MELNILAIGDVVADTGLAMIRRKLRSLIRETGADFTVVNGENAAVVGITPNQAEEILDAGADVVTLGNHTFRQRSICDYLDDCPRILRPANLAPQTPGRGWGVFETNKGPVALIDLIGRCNMDFTELHAEATSEKLAMGYALDGRISALWGTHTHVPTADTQILPKGTGYQTDLGMTGPRVSVLGIRPDLSIQKFRGDVYARYQPAPGPGKLEGALFTLDGATGRCLRAERIAVYD